MASTLTEKARNYLRDYWAITLLAALFALTLSLFLLGWRLGPGGLPVRASMLLIKGVPSGTYVYVDETRRHIVAENGETSLWLTPGMHTVIVDAPEMQPWNELFPVVSGENVTLSPILIAKKPEFPALHGEARDAAARALYFPHLPTKIAPLTLAGGCASIYIANNRILADATSTPTCAAPEYLLCPAEEGGVRDLPCPSSTVIFSASDRLDSVVAYPGREDALLVAAGSSIFVIELDPRSPQFIAPLLKGDRVRVGSTASSSAILSDQKNVYEFAP